MQIWRLLPVQFAPVQVSRAPANSSLLHMYRTSVRVLYSGLENTSILDHIYTDSAARKKSLKSTENINARDLY